MTINRIIFLVLLVLMTSVSNFSQIQEWRKLVALESSRDEVEKILGKPINYFETFGIYETEIGRFSVWYSEGGCHKNVEGLQWNVPAKKMTSLTADLNVPSSLESYIPNKKDFEREELPPWNPRYFYTSPDGTLTFETIRRKNNTEFVESIHIQPSKDKQNLLCKNK